LYRTSLAFHSPVRELNIGRIVQALILHPIRDATLGTYMVATNIASPKETESIQHHLYNARHSLVLMPGTLAIMPGNCVNDIPEKKANKKDRNQKPLTNKKRFRLCLYNFRNLRRL
jgi:hypothetical protein